MVQHRQLCSLVVGLAGLSALAAGCVVRTHSTPVRTNVQASGTVDARGSTGAAIHVDSAPEYTVRAYPPEPLYEEVTVSPGYGYVWIDGYWHWRGGDWRWTRGRWVRERTGYVYVSPYYDYVGGRYVYRSGYWNRRDRLPTNVRVYDRRDGRPATYVRRVRDHRARTY